ncbi:alpha/beta fold hydrolase [Ktedonobacter racemifer]|uniref:Alpha/beta hydrolase fold protein n=1 Tax=Ktedonobacter racemifer DSM 44963 TaxID=485913 RepID=D6U2R7_KTERA|nr:alpha/beta hydrolase [Ktedonobacter racemifer]EFH81031.1 alpha/beta hydrolase fold protein [Ktedonobacter racemifer DSM 44963]
MQIDSRMVRSADGCHLYAEAVGNRDHPAILFIPGASVTGTWWRKQFDSLSDTFYCVRFDLRGNGASDKPSDPAAYQESQRWADDIAAIISAFELSKPTVCAWSYGGYALGGYLQHYGQANLSGVVMVDSGAQLNTDQSKDQLHEAFGQLIGKLFSPDVTAYREGVEDVFKSLTAAPVEDRDRADFHGASFLMAPATWQAMFGRRIDHTEDFERVSLPILVVHGQQDPIFTPRAAEQFREIIPQAQISSYPCAHAPFYECAERFNLELVQLMNDVSSKRHVAARHGSG